MRPHPRARTRKINAIIIAAFILGAAAYRWPGPALIVALVVAVILSIIVMAWDIHKAGIIRRLEK